MKCLVKENHYHGKKHIFMIFVYFVSNILYDIYYIFSQLKVILIPRGYIRMSEYIFDCQNLDGERHLRGRDQECCKTPYSTQVSPSQQIISWPKLSTVLKLSVKNQIAGIFLQLCKLYSLCHKYSTQQKQPKTICIGMVWLCPK